MTIVLPWPPREVHPNARSRTWHKKARFTAAYKRDCMDLLNNVKHRQMFRGQSKFAVTFRPPDNRGRDTDGMIASIKAALDVISIIAGVDDKHFAVTYSRGEPVRGGAVEVTFEVAA